MTLLYLFSLLLTTMSASASDFWANCKLTLLFFSVEVYVILTIGTVVTKDTFPVSDIAANASSPDPFVKWDLWRDWDANLSSYCVSSQMEKYKTFPGNKDCPLLFLPYLCKK